MKYFVGNRHIPKGHINLKLLKGRAEMYEFKIVLVDSLF